MTVSSIGFLSAPFTLGERLECLCGNLVSNLALSHSCSCIRSSCILRDAWQKVNFKGEFYEFCLLFAFVNERTLNHVVYCMLYVIIHIYADCLQVKREDSPIRMDEVLPPMYHYSPL